MLRHEDDPGDFPAGRYVLSELAFWATLALVFAYLLAPSGEGVPYLLLSAIAGAAWLLLRPSQRRHAEALLARRRYVCARCRRRFDGSGPTEIPTH